VFDPPPSSAPNVPGHFCVVCLNLGKKRFELLDSLRDWKDPDGKMVLHRMAYGIKKLWKRATNSKGDTFNPKSIEDFGMHYVDSPRQENGLVVTVFIWSFLNLKFLFFLLFFTFRTFFVGVTTDFSCFRFSNHMMETACAVLLKKTW
jgi:hypothetical protein